MIERRFLGFIEVDSGTVLVGDPLYLLPCVADGRRGIDYAAVIGAVEPASYLDNQPVLLMQRFGGDGTFPVYGEFDDGEFMRILVEFVDANEDSGVDPYP